MTHRHTEWTSAKAKVVTQCLNKPLLGYDGDCEINKILSCTFDILTEVSSIISLFLLYNT